MTDKAKKEIETRHEAISKLAKSSPFKETGTEEVDYNTKLLVLTDLFVEKDINALEKRAFWLKIEAYFFSFIVVLAFLFAVFVAFCQLFNIQINGIIQHLTTIEDIKKIYGFDTINKEVVVSWTVLIPLFIKSFTFYGLVILLGATAWKHAKANFDQAERLLSKRRTDRLLRLYIHLKKGDVTIKDLKALLSLADTKNAFTDIKAEAKAPWGNVISDLIQANTEIAKAVGKNIKNSTKHGESK
jgi:hypothetical protein